MKQSRNWATIERLPERPGVAVMVGNGYWLDGKFHPTSDRSPQGHDRNGHGSRERVHEVAARKPFIFQRMREWVRR